MESIIERNILVNKLVAKIKSEYEPERAQLLMLLNFDADYISKTSDSDLDSIIEYTAYRTALLSWIKTCIINNNGMMFRAYQQSDGNDNAVFWVSTDCIYILIGTQNTIQHIGSRFPANLEGINSLLTMDETNVDNLLVSVLEYAAYRKHKTKGKNKD